jgi:hypothetical protein
MRVVFMCRLCEVDSVELSNFMGVDRAYKKRCGKEKESFRVLSKSHFFRVTFRSSAGGAAGFLGTFHFTSEEVDPPVLPEDGDMDEDGMRGNVPSISSSASKLRPTIMSAGGRDPFVLILFIVITAVAVVSATPTLLVIRRHILLLMAQILEK